MVKADIIFGLLVFCSWLYVFFSWGVWWLRGPRHNWLFPMRKRHFCILRFCSHSISTPHFFSSSFWMLPPLLPLICKRRILTYRPPPFSQAFFTPGVNIGQMATKIRLLFLFFFKNLRGDLKTKRNNQTQNTFLSCLHVPCADAFSVYFIYGKWRQNQDWMLFFLIRFPPSSSNS